MSVYSGHRANSSNCPHSNTFKQNVKQNKSVEGVSSEVEQDQSGDMEDNKIEESSEQVTYDIPIPCTNDEECRSTTSNRSSSSQSTIPDPFEANEDGTSSEPIHVGDEIQFYQAPYTAGDKRGLVRATVLAIDPDESCPLVLSNQYAISKDGFTLIKRVKVKSAGDQLGFWRLLRDFTIQKEGSMLEAGRRANELQNQDFGNIMSRRMEKAREFTGKENFSPMDMVVDFGNRTKAIHRGEVSI
jgi:hypothetical protein